MTRVANHEGAKSALAVELCRATGKPSAEAAIRQLARDLLAATCSPLSTLLLPLYESLGVARVRERNLTIDGALRLRSDGRFDIEVRAGQSVRRQRFTIAHELGHILCRKFAPHSKASEDAAGTKASLEEERLCNIVAEELLIPTESLAPVWAAAAASGNTAAELLRVARRAEVSPDVALIRAARLAPFNGAFHLRRFGAAAPRPLAKRAGQRGTSLVDFTCSEIERMVETYVGSGDAAVPVRIFDRFKKTQAFACASVAFDRGGGRDLAIVVYVHTRPPAGEAATSALSCYRAEVHARARRLPADPQCPECSGSGWQAVPSLRAVRECNCRVMRAISVDAA